jgi:hypothetical protein
MQQVAAAQYKYSLFFFFVFFLAARSNDSCVQAQFINASIILLELKSLLRSYGTAE